VIITLCTVAQAAVELAVCGITARAYCVSKRTAQDKHFHAAQQLIAH
jgi:hypothetical protein